MTSYDINLISSIKSKIDNSASQSQITDLQAQINTKLETVAVDGTTITGDGTSLNPLVATSNLSGVVQKVNNISPDGNGNVDVKANNSKLGSQLNWGSTPLASSQLSIYDGLVNLINKTIQSISDAVASLDIQTIKDDIADLQTLTNTMDQTLSSQATTITDLSNAISTMQGQITTLQNAIVGMVKKVNNVSPDSTGNINLTDDDINYTGS